MPSEITSTPGCARLRELARLHGGEVLGQAGETAREAHAQAAAVRRATSAGSSSASYSRSAVPISCTARSSSTSTSTCPPGIWTTTGLEQRPLETAATADGDRARAAGLRLADASLPDAQLEPMADRARGSPRRSCARGTTRGARGAGPRSRADTPRGRRRRAPCAGCRSRRSGARGPARRRRARTAGRRAPRCPS